MFNSQPKKKYKPPIISFKKKNFFSKKKWKKMTNPQHVFQKTIVPEFHSKYAWFGTQKIFEIYNKNLVLKNKKLFLRQSDKTKWNTQKHMRALRSEKKSKLALAFFQPWKKVIPPTTRKQHFLNTNYLRFRNLRLKDRADFFRTHLGQIMLLTEIYSQTNYEDTWFSQAHIAWKTELVEEDRWYIRNAYDLERKQISAWERHFLLARIYKKSWWYENLIQKKKKPKSAKHFLLDRPNTAFHIHWKQEKREPWKNSLLFRRAVYAGFGERLRKENKFRTLKMKFYLRRKNPRSEKRNQLYKRSHFLLTNFRQRSRLYAKKTARIKQIVSKIIWPFYGNLRIKQMHRIYKKKRVIKSNKLTSNEVLLSCFENRLDVVVYRLNLAPTILWARRLIMSGCIFVTAQQNVTLWESMYASLKKIAFPLKLRDPKKLYLTTLHTEELNHWAMFKFLGQPQKKPSYLLQAGDLIQCAAGNSLSQFKTQSSLWEKPLPTHMLSKQEPRFFWDWRTRKFIGKSFNSWENTSEPFRAAIFLHAPRFGDLNAQDRIKESFFRWTLL